ncbi:MAG: hypothetical protein WC295_06110 [Methanoregula sp.]|jgi:hypothetical protein
MKQLPVSVQMQTTMVLHLDLTAAVGTAHLSTSGRAQNIGIDQQLHTIPLRLLTPVLTGHNRKAPLFVPKEVVAPDPTPV